MATLIGLCEAGVLERIDVLEENELPWRELYATPTFITWLDEVLPSLGQNELDGPQTPLEQVFSLFAEYQSGESFNTDRRFKKLNKTPDPAIWEFKTPAIRIFGWVPRKDAFICCFADEKDRIELMQSYGLYIAKCQYVRDNLDLDEPKFVEGKEYENVISTKN